VARTLADDRNRVIAALLLNWVAGYVDLIGWVVFLGLYTANMTGNVVAIGRAATQGGAIEAARRATPVLAFFGGLFCAALWHARRRLSRLPLALEAMLLLGLAFASTPLPIWVAAVPAFAMGLQNATLTRAGRLSVRTTHVTGTISRLAESVAQLVRTHRRRTRLRVAFLSGLLAAYLAGAICGTVALAAFGLRALLAPAVALILWLVLRAIAS
jgi:uncharacterized membrane protein YoaK (UPF0700 family)